MKCMTRSQKISLEEKEIKPSPAGHLFSHDRIVSERLFICLGFCGQALAQVEVYLHS